MLMIMIFGNVTLIRSVSKCDIKKRMVFVNYGYFH